MERKHRRRAGPSRGGVWRKVLLLLLMAFFCLGVVRFAEMTWQSWMVLRQHRIHGRSLWHVFKARLWEEDVPQPRKPLPPKPPASAPRQRSAPATPRKALKKQKSPSTPPTFSPGDRAKLDGILRKSLGSKRPDR